MSNFPKLVPAFTALIPITPPSAIGSAKTGGLNQVAFITDHSAGSFKSEPGYPIQVDAVFVHGSDYIRADPDGQHLRLNVTSVVKDKVASDALFSFNYTGVINLAGTTGAARVLGGAPDAKTTAFGDVFSQVTFESGHSELKTLEHKVYVGSGRFVLNAGDPVVVEYKISEVVN